jgi:two-component sensor histidine kinase
MALREQEISGQAAEAWYPPAAESVRAARRFVTDVLREHRAEPHDAALLVSELATNAIDHARTPFVVTVHVGETVRVEVADESDALPVISKPTSTAECGRGLAIVRAMSIRWGVEFRRTGKAVWFDVQLTAG